MSSSPGITIAFNDSGRRRALGLLVASLWVIGVVVGLCWLGRYQATAGDDSQQATHLPASFPISLDPHRSTIIMVAHPRCPCTRASFAELAKVLARHPDHSAHVLFFTPRETAADWAHTDLRDMAHAIPGLTAHDDIEGEAARSIGVSTSGAVLVVAPDRQILFRGGLTSGRGHQGDNPSTDAIARVLETNTTDVTLTPTYGCSLASSESCNDSCKEGH